MPRLGPMSLSLLGGLVVAIACGPRDDTPKSSMTVAPGTPVESLSALIRSRYGMNPVIEVRERARVLIGFSPAPWKSTTDAAERDSAYKVARLVWDSYGASHGIDTISVDDKITFGLPNKPDSIVTRGNMFHRKELAGASAPVTLRSEP